MSKAWWGKSRLGAAWQARSGLVRQGEVKQGLAGQGMETIELYHIAVKLPGGSSDEPILLGQDGSPYTWETEEGAEIYRSLIASDLRWGKETQFTIVKGTYSKQ